MNSRSTSPPAAYLRSQRASSPFSFAIACRISTTSAATAAGSRLRHSTSRITSSTRAANAGGPDDHARARQRHVLPGPGLGLLVAREGVEAGRDRAGAAGRPQPHVDLIERAVVGLRRQRADQPLRQPREILRAVERPRAVGLRMLGIEIVDDDEIEIGGRRHLAAAELAEREQRGLLAAGCGRGFRRTVSSTAAVQRADQHVGEPREGARRPARPTPCRTGCARRSGTSAPGRTCAAGRENPRRCAPRRCVRASSASSLASSGSAPKNVGSSSASITCG